MSYRIGLWSPLFTYEDLWIDIASLYGHGATPARVALFSRVAGLQALIDLDLKRARLCNPQTGDETSFIRYQAAKVQGFLMADPPAVEKDLFELARGLSEESVVALIGKNKQLPLASLLPGAG